MAGSDPRSGRALGPTPDRGNVEAEEDPLIELARIVSEDGGFGMPKTEKPKMNRNEATQRSSYEDGLEAELLQELENSLGGRDAPPATPPRTASPRAASTPSAPPRASALPPSPSSDRERDPDDLLRSIEEQLGQFERRQSERLSKVSASFAPEPAEPEDQEFRAGEETRAEGPLAAPATEPSPETQRQDLWRSQRVARLRPLDVEEDEPESAPEPEWGEPDTLPAPPRRANYRFRGPATAGWEQPAPETARSAFPASDPHEDEPSVQADRQPSGLRRRRGVGCRSLRAERKGGPRASILLPRPSQFASSDDAHDLSEAARRRRIADAFPEFEDEPTTEQEQQEERAAINARLAQALESDFADPSHDRPWETDDEEEGDEPKVAAAVASGASRRAAAARAQAAQRGKGARTALITIAGVIVVVLIGGGAALLLRSTESGPASPPPVITADEGPVKVEPPKDQTASTDDTAGDAVYNRVAGNAPASTNEKVVDNSEEPREVARIVLPQTQSDGNDAVMRPVGEQPASTDTTDTSNAASDTSTGSTDEMGPREVPTFTVRPDGTIVANSPAEGEPATSQAAPQQQIAAAAVPPAPAPALAPAAASSDQAPAAAETLSPAAQDAMTPRPAINEPATVAAVAPEPPAPAATGSNAPVNLLRNTEASAVAAGTVVGDGYLVQISSQRSVDQAQSSYADIQKRYPSVLGKLNPVIQEADLGTKGIYYRVRVGPWASRDDAIKVCESLKAAGGNCFVTQ